MRENRQTKVKLIFKCNMIRREPDGEFIIRPFAFHSKIETNLDGTDENKLYDKMIDRIKEEIDRVKTAEGTGWHLHSIISLELHTVEWDPLSGTSYIKLPKYLENKKAIINMKNDDDKCFLWSVLRALNPKDNNSEIDRELKSKIDTLNMKGIKYPITLQDIKKFESLNSNISITVLGYNEKNKVYPLRVSGYIGREHDIVLMLICDEEKKHYCLVKNVSRLLSTQVSNHKEKHHFCLRCMNSFCSHKSLNKHQEYCSNHEAVKIIIPEEEKSILKFNNHYKSEKVPFIIYADIESLVKPIKNCEPCSQSSYTKKYQKHEPISFSYYIKCFDNNVFEPVLRTYTGEDAMQKFVEWLEEDVKEIADIPKVDMIFGDEEAERFKKETKCWIKENLKRVMIKIKKLETIVILLVDIVEPHITSVI